MSEKKVEHSKRVSQPVLDDDEPDDWDKRILRTGCAAENGKLTDCFYEKKDWRFCKAEMAAFQKCWKGNHNDERTLMKDTNKGSRE